jgi:transposase
LDVGRWRTAASKVRQQPAEGQGYDLELLQTPITTGPLEGFNNTVSRIIHRACGIRSLDYLFLKLRQESSDFVPQK